LLPSDKRLGVVGGDRCPAARFSCDADGRAGPPFRLALRHGSHAESLTLGKSCENPVGRSDRPSGDGAGIAPPWSQQLLWRRPSGRRSRRPWCHVSQALGRNRPRGRPTRAGCSSRSADPSGSRCSPSGSTDRRELRCQIVAKGTRAAPSLWCEGHRRVPSPPHPTKVNYRHLTRRRGRGFPLGAGLGPRCLPQMLARLERRMRATRHVVEVHRGQQWDERMYAYGSSAPARTQASLRVWVSALGPAALEARSCGHATPAGTQRAEKCIGRVTIG
jgi:hypothetical protein